MEERNNKYELSALYIAVLSSLPFFFCADVAARSYTFEPSMLNVDGNDIDLSIFESGAQLPGTYYVDIMLNGKLVDTKEMEFSRERNKDGEFVLSSCLTQSMLNRYGVKVGDYPELFVNSSNGKVCGDLSVIPGAFSYFDFYNQQLNLSIPNVALYPKYKGIASEELWDNGINAFLMNYQANAQINQYRNKKNREVSSYWARIEPGMNIGSWRIRNLTTFTKENGNSEKRESVYTYAERGLTSIKSNLLIGESYTNSDIFDSISFRG